MKLDFSINLSDLKNDLLTIQKYANDLKQELSKIDINVSQLNDLSSIVLAAVSQLRYFKDAKSILESSNDQLKENAARLANENLELRRVNSANKSVIDRINQLAQVYNSNDLDRVIGDIIREHNELIMMKELIKKYSQSDLNSIIEQLNNLSKNNQHLKDELENAVKANQNLKNKHKLECIGYAFASFLATTLVSKTDQDNR